MFLLFCEVYQCNFPYRTFQELLVLYLKHFNTDKSGELYCHLILSANNILVVDKEGRYTPSIQILTLEINHLKLLTALHLSICISAVLNSTEVGKWFLSYSPTWTLSGMIAEA